MRKFSLCLVVVLTLLASLVVEPLSLEAAPSFADPSFQQTWERVDKLLTERTNVGRGFIWGPASIYTAREAYSEALNGLRTVQYFDKGRMEINNPAVNRNDPYYVTSGLLVKELVLGRQQNGDNVLNYTQGNPSEVQVAGDPNLGGANVLAPTYRSFRNVATFNNDNPVEQKIGQQVTQRIDRAGNVTTITSPDPNIHMTAYNLATRHNIAEVFVDYAASQGLVWNGSNYVNGPLFYPDGTYVFGLPITEPYWVRAVVAGIERDVLVQLFERRTLTYTPSNDINSRVEMGNVGQHYFRWRYLENIGQGTNSPFTPSMDYSQARAPYLKSGPVVQGGTGNVSDYNTGSTFSSSWPVYDPDKKLAIVSTEQGLVAINLADFSTPTFRWQFLGPNGFTPVTLSNGIVYCGGEGGNIYAINEMNGSIVWQATLGGLGFDSLIVPGTTNFYFRRDFDGQLHAHSLADGSPRWIVDPGNGVRIVSGPVLGPNETIYVGASDSKIYAFRPDGSRVGTESWQTPTLDSPTNRYAMSVGSNGRVYVGTTAGTLYALNSNGSVQSQKRLTGGQGILTVPAVVTGSNGAGRVYVGSDDGRVYGVDANNVATVQWTFAAPGGGTPFARSSAAVVDGFVYFGMDEGNIYRVEAANAANFTVLANTGAAFGTNPAVVNSGYLIIASRDGVVHFIR